MNASIESVVLEFFISEFGDIDAAEDIPEVVSTLIALGFESSDLDTLFSTPSIGHISEILNIWRRRRQVLSKYKPNTIIDFMAGAAIETAVLKWFEYSSLQQDFADALSAEGAGFRKTRFLYHSYLSGSLFEIGRKLSDTERNRSNRYLEATIPQAEYSMETALPYELAEQERFLLGKMGFSHLMLAFATQFSDREDHLDKAVTNLSRAGQLGDNSLERTRYFCTAVSELGDFRDDPELLGEAIGLIKSALDIKPQDAETLVVAARLLVQSSSAKYSIEQEADADALNQAIRYLDAALQSKSKFNPNNLQGRRGQASLYLSWDSGSTDTLNSAITDLRFAYAAGET